jgi:hypothetical protein
MFGHVWHVAGKHFVFVQELVLQPKMEWYCAILATVVRRRAFVERVLMVQECMLVVVIVVVVVVVGVVGVVDGIPKGKVVEHFEQLRR